MKITCLMAFLLVTTLSFAQQTEKITTLDFVKIKDGHREEALYYYENNWKAFREIALERGYIAGYEILLTAADSIADFDIILITEYADSLQLQQIEERFQQVTKETRPGGIKLLNDLKPGDFRQNMYSKEARPLFSAGN